jgi:predicted O-linked N-acetylglucosamine transferase (SPINDLY family)
MRLLAAVPESVLWLLATNADATRDLRAAAAPHGIASERIVFAPSAPFAAHLARHRLADLALDTLPYNAHTTACDALWAGLPIVTCPGVTFPSRVAASLLNAMGLPELVTSSLEDYAALALALATDPARLAALKTKVAHQRTTAPLFDTARRTRDLEAAFTVMAERHRRGEAPADFAV